MVLYLIHNKINGKYYVGKTIYSLERRWSEHQTDARSGSSSYLHRAIRKYGAENFVISPLMSTLGSDEELKKWEVELISLFRANDPNHGYNLTKGGEGMSGFVVPDETRRKISETLRTKYETTELRQRLSKAHMGLHGVGMTGKTHSEDSRRKMSASRQGIPSKKRGVPLSDEHKAQLREAWKQRPPMTDETRQRLSETTAAYWKRRKAEETNE